MAFGKQNSAPTTDAEERTDRGTYVECATQADPHQFAPTLCYATFKAMTSQQRKHCQYQAGKSVISAIIAGTFLRDEDDNRFSPQRESARNAKHS